MKKIFYFSILILLVVSCSGEDEQKRIYYNFTNEDNDKLISYDLNQILRFKNENNEVLNFTVISNSLDYRKTKYTSPGMGIPITNNGPRPIYDSDEKIIELEPILNSNFFENLKIIFRRLPIINTYQEELSADDTIYPSRFSAYLDEFPLWNNENGNYATIRFENQTSEMVINNTNYENVYTLSSGNSDELGILNVHIIYYDKYYGIIGFDDLNDMHWRLFN